MSSARSYPRLSYPPYINPERARSEADRILDATSMAVTTRSDLKFSEWAAAALRVNGQEPAGTERDVIRQALSSWGVNTAFTGLIGQSFHDGYRDSPDTLAAIYDVQPVANFLPQLAISQYEAGRLHNEGTGLAASIWLGMGGMPWAIDRYAATAAIDEEDLLNSPAVSLQLVASREMGRACKRTILDLAWSLILSNPTMPDSKTCFHSDHGNLGSGALAEGTLDSGLEGLGKQIFQDDEGAPIHVNGRGEYLICAPKVYGLGRRLARHLQLGTSGDLEVRSESRLSTIGIADPQTETLITSPSDSAWLLGTPARTITCLVVGALEGKLEPQIRVNQFGENQQTPAGRWGVTMDCKLDVGAVLVNWRGLYFSPGV